MAAGWRGGCCGCCSCCCGERESRTPEELTILGETEDEEDEILPRKDYESLDYDRCLNEPYLEVLESLDSKKGQRYEAVKWMMVFAIGVCTGMVGLFVDFFVYLFTRIKFHVVQNSVEDCSEKGCLAISLLELLGFNLTFIFLASLFVLIQWDTSIAKIHHVLPLVETDSEGEEEQPTGSGSVALEVVEEAGEGQRPAEQSGGSRPIP